MSYSFKKFLFLILLLLPGFSTAFLKAQDASFGQFYASPLYLNPALTGNAECSRLQLNYRNQWPAISNAFTTYAVSYDQNLESIRSGFGVLLMSDRQASGLYNRSQAAAYFSHRIQIAYEAMLYFGMKAGLYQISVDWGKLVFPDMIDPFTGNLLVGNEPPPGSNSFLAADFGVGINFEFADRFFFGFAADHLSQPVIRSYSANEERLAVKYVVHGGMNFNASAGNFGDERDGDLMLMPSLLFLHQNNLNLIDIGVYARLSSLLGGIRFRHAIEQATGVGFLLGLQWDGIRIGYSFDYSLGAVGKGSGQAHEISFGWDFCMNYYNRRYKHTIKSLPF